MLKSQDNKAAAVGTSGSKATSPFVSEHTARKIQDRRDGKVLGITTPFAGQSDEAIFQKALIDGEIEIVKYYLTSKLFTVNHSFNQKFITNESRDRIEESMTPLHIAAYYNRAPLVKVLLSCGADTNHPYLAAVLCPYYDQFRICEVEVEELTSNRLVKSILLLAKLEVKCKQSSISNIELLRDLKLIIKFDPDQKLLPDYISKLKENQKGFYHSLPRLAITRFEQAYDQLIAVTPNTKSSFFERMDETLSGIAPSADVLYLQIHYSLMVVKNKQDLKAFLGLKIDSRNPNKFCTLKEDKQELELLKKILVDQSTYWPKTLLPYFFAQVKQFIESSENPRLAISNIVTLCNITPNIVADLKIEYSDKMIDLMIVCNLIKQKNCEGLKGFIVQKLENSELFQDHSNSLTLK